jgi:hypothetical protein
MALAGTALWAVAGLGVGALVRNQVPALVGLCAWLLFVENLLVGNVPDAGRFAPVPRPPRSPARTRTTCSRPVSARCYWRSTPTP